MRTSMVAKTVLGLSLLLGTPGVARAFSLGDIHVTSHLNEVFYAEIPIKLAVGETADKMQVALGTLGDYLVLELHRPTVVGNIEAKLKLDRRGPRIELQSKAPIAEPFFNLLVKTVSGMGSHFRNYPVMLDIPVKLGMVEELPVKGAAKARTPSQPRQEDLMAERAAPKASRPAEPSALVLGESYGPVRAGETLSGIARHVGASAGVSESQAMVALWRKNTGKFIRGNMNGLLKGAVLALPTPEEMRGVTLGESRSVRQQQHEAWLNLASVKVDTAKAPVARKTREKPATPEKAPASPEKAPAAPAPETTVKATLPPRPGKEDFDLKMTVMPQQSGEGKEAPVPTEAAQPPADTDAVKLQMSGNLEQLQELEAKLAEATAKLGEAGGQLDQAHKKLSDATAQSEKSRKEQLQLKSQLAGLQQQVATLEQEKQAGMGLEGDLPIYAGGVAGVGILAGALAWFSRRRKRKDEQLLAAAAAANAAAPAPVAAVTPIDEEIIPVMAAAAAGWGAHAMLAKEEETQGDWQAETSLNGEDESDHADKGYAEAPVEDEPWRAGSGFQEPEEAAFPGRDDDESGPYVGGALDLGHDETGPFGLGGDETGAYDLGGDEGLNLDDDGEGSAADLLASQTPARPLERSWSDEDFSAFTTGEAAGDEGALDELPSATFLGMEELEELPETPPREFSVDETVLDLDLGSGVRELGLEFLAGLEDDTHVAPSRSGAREITNLDELAGAISLAEPGALLGRDREEESLDLSSLGGDLELGPADGTLGQASRGDLGDVIEIPDLDVVDLDFMDPTAPVKEVPPTWNLDDLDLSLEVLEDDER